MLWPEAASVGQVQSWLRHTAHTGAVRGGLLLWSCLCWTAACFRDSSLQVAHRDRQALAWCLLMICCLDGLQSVSNVARKATEAGLSAG